MAKSAVPSSRLYDWLPARGQVDRQGRYSTRLVWRDPAHSFIRSPFSFGACRFVLGFGESGNFPAAIKSVSEWFPKKDRAFATGIFNAGSNIATMIGPMMFVYLTAHYGWRTCFLLTVSSGLVVLVLWFFTKTPPPPQDDDDPNAITLTWTQVAAYRQT